MPTVVIESFWVWLGRILFFAKGGFIPWLTGKHTIRHVTISRQQKHGSLQAASLQRGQQPLEEDNATEGKKATDMQTLKDWKEQDEVKFVGVGAHPPPGQGRQGQGAKAERRLAPPARLLQSTSTTATSPTLVGGHNIHTPWHTTCFPTTFWHTPVPASALYTYLFSGSKNPCRVFELGFWLHNNVSLAHVSVECWITDMIPIENIFKPFG